MSTGRMIVRAAVSAVASLALVIGAGAATSFAAEPNVAAQTCAAEQSALKEAKGKLKKAKAKKKAATKQLKKAKKTRTKADDKKAKKKLAKATKKVKKLKKKVKAKRTAYENCLDNAAKDKAAHDAALAAALAELEKRIAEFTAMQASGDVAALPSEVSGPMESAFTEMLTHLAALQSQFPTMDVAGLQAALAMLQGLDPTQLQSAITALATEIQSADEPSDLQALLDGLIGGLPGGGAGEMDEVQAAFEALVAQLQAFDPATAGDQLPLIRDAVTAALEALSALQDSTMLEDLISALSALGGGSMPSDPSDVADLLATLTALNSGALPTNPADLANLVGGLLNGTIPTEGLPGGDLIDGVIDLLPPVIPGDTVEIPGLPVPIPIPIPIPTLPELPIGGDTELPGGDDIPIVDDVVEGVCSVPILGGICP